MEIERKGIPDWVNNMRKGPEEPGMLNIFLDWWLEHQSMEGSKRKAGSARSERETCAKLYRPYAGGGGVPLQIFEEWSKWFDLLLMNASFEKEATQHGG